MGRNERPEPDAVVIARRFQQGLEAREMVMIAQLSQAWDIVESGLFPEAEAFVRKVNERIERTGQAVTENRLRSMVGWQQLKNTSRQLIGDFLSVTENVTDAAIQAIIQQALGESRSLVALVGQEFGITLLSQHLNIDETLVESVWALTIGQNPLSEWAAKIYGTVTTSMARELLLGFAQGKGPLETARQMVLQGSAAGFGNIKLVARDLHNRAYREAQRRQYDKYDMVIGYRRLAARKKNTCPACLALDGTVYQTSELMPVHPQDRCAQIPLLKNLPYIKWQHGVAWFKGLPAADQMDILGPGRYQAWKDGKFKFEDLVTHTTSEKWGPGVQVTPLKNLI